MLRSTHYAGQKGGGGRETLQGPVEDNLKENEAAAWRNKEVEMTISWGIEKYLREASLAGWIPRSRSLNVEVSGEILLL